MEYNAIKHAHAGFAYLSILLFVLRFGLFSWRPVLQQVKILNIIPHIVHTGLVVAAVALSVSLQQYPITDAWLTAKLVGLLLYVGLATVAIKRGNKIAAILAIVVFAYIIGVAKNHSLLSWLAS